MTHAMLSAGAVLFVRPEDMEDGVSEGFYATVTSCSRTDAQCLEMSGSPSPRAFDLPLAVAVLRTVPLDEPSGNAVSQWLRRGVACKVGTRVYFGQVIGTAGDQVWVATVQGARWVPVEDLLGRVAPVLAMLMFTKDWPANEWTTTDVKNANDAIGALLEPQLLADGSLAQAPSVAELADAVGLGDVRGQDKRMWEEPRTGITRETTLNHAVLYTYYENAPRSPPQDIQLKIGRSVCDDPVLHSRRAGTQSEMVLGKRGSCEPSATRDGDEETKDSEPPAQRLRAHGQSQSVGEVPAARFAWFGNLPDPTLAPPPLQPLEPLPSAGQWENFMNAVASGSGPRQPTSKFAFNPPSARVDVHRAITASSHVGKSPALFIEDVLSSQRQRFKRVPGVLMRAYDFLFGRRGLSIMHFVPMSVDDLIAETEDRSQSSEDYSLGVKAPVPRRPVEWADLQDGVSGLVHYCTEFCDTTTVRVVIALVGFVSTMQGSGTWPKCHLQTLEYWINQQLLEYRGLVHTDVVYNSNAREAALAWFTPSNPSLEQLRSMLIIRMVSGASSRVPASVTRSDTADHRQATPAATRPAGGRGGVERTTPQAVLAAIPRDAAGRELCLRFASQRGCVGRRPGLCNFNDRAHYVPTSLPAVVADFITQRFGGLAAGQQRA